MKIRKAFDYVFGNVPATFQSVYSLPESVARLRANTNRTILSSLFRQSAVGPVTESHVRLQRVIPMFGNSFKPVFVGTFRQMHGQIILEGRFTMFLFSKIFMTIWLALALAWTCLAFLAIFGVIHSQADQGKHLSTALSFLFPFAGIGFFMFGIAFVRVCWRLSRGDIDYLSTVIGESISKGTPNQTL